MCSALFMTNQNVLYSVFVIIQSIINRHNCSSGISKYCIDLLRDQRFHHRLSACCFCCHFFHYLSVTHPVEAHETHLAYLYNTPFFALSWGRFQFDFRCANSSWLTFKVMLFFFVSMLMLSPFSTSAIVPPS